MKPQGVQVCEREGSAIVPVRARERDNSSLWHFESDAKCSNEQPVNSSSRSPVKRGTTN